MKTSIMRKNKPPALDLRGAHFLSEDDEAKEERQRETPTSTLTITASPTRTSTVTRYASIKAAY